MLFNGKFEVSGVKGVLSYSLPVGVPYELDRHSFSVPEQVLNYALMQVVESTHACAGTIRLFEEYSQNLELRASYGVHESYRKAKQSLPVNTSLAGFAFQTEKACFVKDIRECELYRKPEYAIKEGVISMISTPLVACNKKFGVISIYFSRPKNFVALEQMLNSIIASLVATLYHSYHLHRQQQFAGIKAMKIISEALEKKQNYTVQKHITQQTALKIAKELGLKKDNLRLISALSLLLDIGNITIPDSILSKPGKLNEAEWASIRQHPVAGAMLLSTIDRFYDSTAAVRHHHERIDGKGYPDGLKGRSIPRLARILAIASAYGAMTSNRPYREKLTERQAERELIENAGKQFDERMVEAYLGTKNGRASVAAESKLSTREKEDPLVDTQAKKLQNKGKVIASWKGGPGTYVKYVDVKKPWRLTWAASGGFMNSICLSVFKKGKTTTLLRPVNEHHLGEVREGETDINIVGPISLKIETTGPPPVRWLVVVERD